MDTKGKADESPEKAPLSKRKLTYFEATINLIKCIIGAGILGGPYGFHRVGWVMGIIIASISIFTIVYSTRILVAWMREICRVKELDDISYPDAVHEGFKDGPLCFQKMQNIAPIIVKCFLILYHFLCGPLYIVLISSSIRDVVIQYTSIDWDVKIYILLLAPLIMIIYLVNNLKALTPFSVIATTLILLGLSLVLYHMLSTKMQPFSSLHVAVSPISIPLYVGMVLLTSTSPGVVLAISRAMKVPHHFLAYYGVLNVAMTLIYILVTSFSLVGYWRYGEEIKDNILLNIPREEKLAQATKLLYAIAIFFSYPLQLFPVVQIMWTEGFSVKCLPNRRFWYEMLFRIGIVIASTIVALSIPFFHIIAALNGCIAITILNMIMPALLDISLRHPDNYGPGHLALVRDIILIIFATFFCITGIAESIHDLVNEFSMHKLD